LNELEIVIEQRTYEAGEIVFDEGDGGEHLFLVGKGTVLISKKGRGGEQETLTLKKPGTFFGEMSLLDHQPRSARATCTERTVLGRVAPAGLERYLAHSPETAMHFARTINQGLRSMNSLFIDELLNAERMSLVGKMMSSMVHDLRNPVASIMMASEWLATKDDPKLKSKGAMLQRATDRMQAMIQEVLDYSRGRSQVNPEATTVRDLIEDLEEQMLSALPPDKVEVRRELHYDGAVLVDRNRFMRLLCNVVKNATEAMADGGTLTVRVNRLGDLIKF
jgi:signal transduction histidine kinase